MKAVDHSMASIETTKAITKAMAGASQRSRSRIGSREPPRLSRHGWIRIRNIIVQSIPSKSCAILRRILALPAAAHHPRNVSWHNSTRHARSS